ncbi:MAG TPA: cupin domain-containing protein [Geminicoccaceae bacterium]
MNATTQETVVRTLRFEDDGRIPNNPKLPVLLYPGVLELEGAPDPAAVAEALFARNGWGGSWRNGVFPFPHYHSNAHEVLGICAGRARVRLGGAAGEALEVGAGDVVVLPAGTGHQNLGASADFLVVGAYPAGQEDYDLCRGGPGERPRVLETIRDVPLPDQDPVFGRDGPLLTHWPG